MCAVIHKNPPPNVDVNGVISVILRWSLNRLSPRKEVHAFAKYVTQEGPLKKQASKKSRSFTGNSTHPLGGSVIIALGLTRSESTMMRRCEPSKEATSMRSFVESVQNTVRPRWSMAMPSGLSKSVGRFQFKHQILCFMRRDDVKGEQSRSEGST